MGAMSWASIAFYCIFGVFVFYQQLHAKNFRGESQWFLFALNVSALLGVITALAYLVYYGWSVAWWAPIAILAIGVLVAGFLGVLVERLVGALAVSCAAFVGWPLAAYFMFRFVPVHG